MTEFRTTYLSAEEQYITWLYSKVGLGTREYGCFWRVIRRLFAIPFPVIVNRDINRVTDAEHLRMDFVHEYHIDVRRSDFTQRRVSVLEVLVAFALRIQSDIMWDPDDEDRAPLWFWSMIENVGVDLRKYQDGYFNAECMVNLDEMIEKAIYRDYQKTGMGGFFPLKNPKKDQKKVELWYQMQFWIDENFPI